MKYVDYIRHVYFRVILNGDTSLLEICEKLKSTECFAVARIFCQHNITSHASQYISESECAETVVRTCDTVVKQ